MFCTKCGAYNNDDAERCSVCQLSFTENFENAEENSKIGVELNSKIQKNSPKTYFFISAIAAVLGSIPFGTAAMVLSAMTDISVECGDIETAENYSKKTRLFCFISLFVGIVKYISIVFWFAVYSLTI